MKFFVKHIHPWINMAALAIVGFLMIFKPNLEQELSGRTHRGMTQLIYKYVWSLPVGLLLVAIAGYLIYHKIKKDKAASD